MYRPTIPLNNVGGLYCYVADGENYALSKKGKTGDKEDWVGFSRPTRMKSPHAKKVADEASCNKNAADERKNANCVLNEPPARRCMKYKVTPTQKKTFETMHDDNVFTAVFLCHFFKPSLNRS
jgi:hypothetical protein